MDIEQKFWDEATIGSRYLVNFLNFDRYDRDTKGMAPVEIIVLEKTDKYIKITAVEKGNPIWWVSKRYFVSFHFLEKLPTKQNNKIPNLKDFPADKGDDLVDGYNVSQWGPNPAECKHISQAWVETSFTNAKGRREDITRKLICMHCGSEIDPNTHKNSF